MWGRLGKCEVWHKSEAIRKAVRAPVWEPGGLGMHLSSWISPLHVIAANGFTKFKKLVTHLTAGRLRNWVKCSKRMSGTESLFPELSRAGRCEIVQSPRALPRRFSVNCRTRGKVPRWDVCAVKGKSQKRVQSISVPETLCRHWDLAN